MAMDGTAVTVIRQEMSLVGVPVETEHFKRNFLENVVNGCVVAAPAWRNLPSLLKRLLERPMAVALLEEL